MVIDQRQISTGNYINYKVWNEFAYPFTNVNDGTVEAWEWISNLSHILMCMRFLIHAGIKFMLVKGDPYHYKDGGDPSAQ